MGSRRSRHGNRDGNHEAMVKLLRENGALVEDLAGVGNGCPDLLIGFRGSLMLLELKKDAKEKLRPNQVGWFAAWRGYPLACIHSPEQAIDVLNAMPFARGHA